MMVSRRKVVKVLSGMPLLACLPSLGLMASPLEASSELDVEVLSIHSREGPHKLRAEVASSLRERVQGLMDRTSLADDAGMLFLYSRLQSPRSGFWMYRTKIPLDIAFIDRDGTIVAIRTMTPCEAEAPSQCPAYSGGVPYIAALEVNAGYFARQGIEVGDCVTLPGDMASQCRE